MKSIKLSDIASILDGNLIGNDVFISGVASIERAKEGEITFLFQKKYLAELEKSKASAFVVTEGTDLVGKNVVVVKNPSLAQAKLLSLFFPERNYKHGVSEKATVLPSVVLKENVTIMDFAFIDENTTIDEGSVIYPFVYIGKNVKIGKHTIVYPHVVIMDDTEIGSDVKIYSGAIIGSDGFGYAFNGQKYEKIPQIGKVVIGESVEIGANTTIDRATLEETKIGNGTKLDNLIMVGHNVKIGNDTVIAAQAGIAGSTEIGSYVVMGGQVAIADHVKIGNKVMVGGRTGIMSNIEDGRKIAGLPARDYKKWLKIEAYIDKLPEMKKAIDLIMQKLGINMEEK